MVSDVQRRFQRTRRPRRRAPKARTRTPGRERSPRRRAGKGDCATSRRHSAARTREACSVDGRCSRSRALGRCRAPWPARRSAPTTRTRSSRQRHPWRTATGKAPRAPRQSTRRRRFPVRATDASVASGAWASVTAAGTPAAPKRQSRRGPSKPRATRLHAATAASRSRTGRARRRRSTPDSPIRLAAPLRRRPASRASRGAFRAGAMSPRRSQTHEIAESSRLRARRVEKTSRYANARDVRRATTPVLA